MRIILFSLLLLVGSAYADINASNIASAGLVTITVNKLSLKKVITLELPSSFMGKDAEDFDELSGKMYEEPFDKVDWNFRVQGIGGDIFTGNRFVQAVQKVQELGNKVTMQIIGPSYSMHAFIACSADELVFNKGASLLFHQPYSVDALLFGFIPYKTTSLSLPETIMMGNIYNLCVSKGILTPADVKLINAGKDVIVVKSNNTYLRTTTNDSFSLLDTFDLILQSVLAGSLILIFISLAKRV